MDFTSFSSTQGDLLEFDQSELTLGDKLKIFKSSSFDPESYLTGRCRHMSEKEIRHLCNYLVDLKKASAEEMRKSVYSNYTAFIRTSREISDLEGQLLSLRHLLSARANIVHDLAEGVGIDSLSGGPDDFREDDLVGSNDKEEHSKIERWLAQYIENLEVLLAERRVSEALDALEEGEYMAKEAKHKGSLSSSAIASLHTAIMEHRKKLSDQLAEAARLHSISVVELRSVVQALKCLGDGPRAHRLLLKSHHEKLESNIQTIHPSGSTSHSAYTAALSQLVFSTIAQASSDSLAIFDEEPAYASELVRWAVKQTENFSLLMKKNVLALPAASGGLRVVSECVQICFGHCSLLEARGLALSPVLSKIFRPLVEQALTANLKRIEQSTGALAAADDWLINYPPVSSRAFGTTSITGTIASQPKLAISGHKFNSMVQELCEDISPLENLQLSDQALDGVLQVFNSYMNMMKNAFPGSSETELEGCRSRIVSIAYSEEQQISMLANALILADELLPRATIKLSPSLSQQAAKMDDQNLHRAAAEKQLLRPAEQRELKRRLQRFVDQLRDIFCRQHALEIIFTDDGVVRLVADMYLSLDDNTDEPEWFPSPIFQELFAKLTRIASLTSEMFIGRERFATILLMRLTETIILWLSDDQNFWEEIEEGPRPLGPFGLQQFYLDMEFVIFFASQGRYLSRNLHQVIKNIIGRAIEAVAASKIDPYSVLPEDDWFADVAQIAIKMLTGKANFGNVDDGGGGGSPTTASFYGKSSSPVHSHGSN